MKAKKVTLQQIADRLNVSKTLVSRALLGKYGVGDEMRQRIIDTAEELGYPFAAAGTAGKPLARRSHMIATLIPRGFLGDLTYWGALLEQIESELQRAGYSMILSPVSQDKAQAQMQELKQEQAQDRIQAQAQEQLQMQEQELPPSIKQRQADGVLLLGPIAPELIQAIRQTGLPAVMVDGNPLHGMKIDHVLADNFTGMKELTAAVLHAGHRRLAFIGSPGFSFSYAERLRGFRQAVEDFGSRHPKEESVITYLRDEIQGEHTLVEIDEALSALLQEASPPTALVCANDAIAVSLLAVLPGKKPHCPDGLAVTGFDNASASEAYRLTTMDVNHQGIAAHAVNLILQRLAGFDAKPCTLQVAGELIERDSIRMKEENV